MCIPVAPIVYVIAVERCECAQLCDDVRKDTPTDTHVLHTLRLVYAREGRHGEVTAMYQAAAAAAPGDAMLQEGVFASLVRYRADCFRPSNVARGLDETQISFSRSVSDRHPWVLPTVPVKTERFGGPLGLGKGWWVGLLCSKDALASCISV